MRVIYLLTSIGILLLYSVAAWGGWEAGTPKKERAGKSVRSSSGGRYYTTGYRGGK